MTCPHCQKEAPIIFKGVFAFCAACDRPRAPFSGKALNFVGKPSKWGARVGQALGVFVLIFGLLLAAALILFFQVLLPTASIGYALGLPIALASVVLAALFMITSRRLRRVGSDAERQARIEALYALAVHRGGTLTATDAAPALQLTAAVVDALLGDLAKHQPDHVSLEFDEEGRTFYLFSHAGTRPHPFGAKYRVKSDGKVRVADALGVDGPREALDDEELDRSRK